MSRVTTKPGSFSLKRATALARFNFILMMRNRTTLIYGIIMPLVPLILLFVAGSLDDASATPLIGSAWLMALIFPTFYNVLSMFVTRRDELVLKRLRTGEVTDSELIVSMALPGALLTVVAALLSVPVAVIAGLSLPLNPIVLVVGLAFAIVTFVAFAFWTASWTKTAEAAQLTSSPIMIFAVVGAVGASVTGLAGELMSLTPGAAVNDLIAVGWFGLEPGESGNGSLGWIATFEASLPALAVLTAWTAFAFILARRSLRWEPRI